MTNCVFCKIAKKEIPTEFIYENGAAVVFRDIRPSAPVHYLVIPKKHILSIIHLEKDHRDVIADIIYAAQETARKLNLKGYKLVFNVGKEGGQIINHLHLHLLGGWNKQSDIEAMPHPGLDK